MDERDSGGTEPEPEAAAPAAPAAERAEVRPATTPNRYEAHPAFQTGEVLLDPALREEMVAYWRAQAEWEKTREGPAPRPPRVKVEAHAAGEASEAAAVRGAMDEEDAAGAAVEAVTAAATVTAAVAVAATAAEAVTATATETVTETATETVTETATETVTETATDTVTETAAPALPRPESSAPIAVDQREATIEARRARADRAGRMTMIAATAALLVLGAVLAGVLRGPADPAAQPPSAAATVPPAAAAKPAPRPRVTAPPSAASTFTPEAAPSASSAKTSTAAPPRVGAARAPAPTPAPPPSAEPPAAAPAPSPISSTPRPGVEGRPEF